MSLASSDGIYSKQCWQNWESTCGEIISKWVPIFLAQLVGQNVPHGKHNLDSEFHCSTDRNKCDGWSSADHMYTCTGRIDCRSVREWRYSTFFIQAQVEHAKTAVGLISGWIDSPGKVNFKVNSSYTSRWWKSGRKKRWRMSSTFVFSFCGSVDVVLPHLWKPEWQSNICV